MSDQVINGLDQFLTAMLPEHVRAVVDLLHVIEHAGRALLLGALIANRASGV